jgi:hypothetical protein
VLWWAAAYVLIVAAAAVIVASRREPTIVRGDWVFLLTALFVLVAATATAVRGGRFSLGELAAVVLVLLGGWFVQSRWWVVGANATAVGATIEECASRICAPTTRSGQSATVSVPGGAMQLRIAPAGRSTMIVFVASARHRKVALFRRLFAKQYRSVMPTVRLGGSASGAA